jgi:hypothetical protein
VEAQVRESQLQNRSVVFSAGHLIAPQPSDSRFDELGDAVNKAIEASVDDDVWAVWEDDSGEVLAVVYQQIVYLP